MRKSNGFSFTGFVMVLVVVCVLGVVAMKVVPMYMEFGSVKTAMNAVSNEEYTSVAAVKESLRKRLSISYVESVQGDDIDVSAHDGVFEVDVDYYVEKPLVANLSLTAHFQYTVNTK